MDQWLCRPQLLEGWNGVTLLLGWLPHHSGSEGQCSYCVRYGFPICTPTPFDLSPLQYIFQDNLASIQSSSPTWEQTWMTYMGKLQSGLQFFSDLPFSGLWWADSWLTRKPWKHWASGCQQNGRAAWDCSLQHTALLWHSFPLGSEQFNTSQGVTRATSLCQQASSIERGLHPVNYSKAPPFLARFIAGLIFILLDYSWFISVCLKQFASFSGCWHSVCLSDM